MSITVKQFDDRKAKEELKKCPKIVRDYVKILERSIESWKDISNKCIKKLRNPENNG